MKAVTWNEIDGVLELVLQHPPCNEIGTELLAALEQFVPELEGARAVLIRSDRPGGFSAGADLRELHAEVSGLDDAARRTGIRSFLDRIHAVLDAIDAAPCPVVAAVHGVVFGGGFELALACDVIVADATARFAFPELRLGLIPGFGGLPRLDRDCSNALVRDLLFTGRSIQAKRAHQAGFVSQVVGAGHAVTAARAVTQQVLKFDPHVVARAKRFAKPIPAERLRAEKELFLELFDRPAVQEALARFVARDDAQPYLP